MMNSILVENSEAIKRIESEIQRYQHDKIEHSKDDSIKETRNKSNQKCRYFNRGHCRNKSECLFVHPSQICSTYLEEGKCEVKTCASRHPKMCKWMRAATGCRRQNCDYLHVHVTLASDDGQQNMAHKSFPCAGCKSCFDDIACVVNMK